MIYGYIRVSTDKQTVENQRFEINQFCIFKRYSDKQMDRRNNQFCGTTGSKKIWEASQ